MSNNTDTEKRHEVAQTETESNAASMAHRFGQQKQAEQVHRRKNNPEFYEKYTESSLEDSELWGDYVEEYAPLFSDDFVLSNRRPIYRRERELLNRAWAQETVVGATPGETLRRKPLLNALAQGVHPELDEPVRLSAAGQSAVTITKPGYTPPMSGDERAGVDDLAAVMTARHAMAVDKAGSEALTTATSENRTVREEEEQSNSIISGAAGVID